MSLTTLDAGRYIDVNESFLQMSGYDRQQVIGNTSLELGIFQEPEDRERLIGPLRENGSVRNLELKFRTKGGEFRILLSSAELIQLGGQPCVLVASSDITERKRLEEQHLHAENELSQLTARLFNLQDEERRRIARELHDGTAQNLFAISIDIDLMRKQTSNGDSEINSLLDESATLCEQSLQEIRTLSYLLHPPLLDQVGLVSALKWYVEGFTKRTGIEVNVVALEGVGRMGSEIETALFRIVQESLSNIRRHSGSETANIRLRRDSREITLEIKDQGKGMNVHEHFGPTAGMPELGVGIPGMRQRLRQLGGRLDIITGASGTLVTAVIPLTDVADNGTKPS
jgi:PAS domain S-box-containing protein